MDDNSELTTENLSFAFDVVTTLGEPLLKGIRKLLKSEINKSKFAYSSEDKRENLFKKIENEVYSSDLDNYLEGKYFVEVIIHQMSYNLSQPFDFQSYFVYLRDDFIKRHAKYKSFTNGIGSFISEYGNSLLLLYKQYYVDDEGLVGVHTLIQMANDTHTGLSAIKEDTQEIKRLLSDFKSKNNGETGDSYLLHKGEKINDKVFHSRVSITDSFVDNCYEKYLLSNDGEWEQDTSSSMLTIEEILDVVKSSKLLLIEGGYGTGKSFLSKYLYLKLPQNESQKFFYYSTVFFSDLTKLPLFPRNSYIFIDSVDMIVYCDNNTDEVIGFLKDVFEKNPTCHYIINMRTRAEDANDPLGFDPLRYYAMDINAYDTVMIKTIGFANRRVINSFFEKIAPDDSRANLEAKHINRMNKHAVETCFIPLFALVVGLSYYSDPNSFSLDKKDALRIYSDFADKTIYGKFSDEMISYKGNTLKLSEYKTLLQRIAVEMISNKKIQIDYAEDASDNDTTREASKYENSLYKHNTLFPMDIDSFSRKLKNDISNLYDKFGSAPDINTDNVINNYFFSMYKYHDKKYVYFTDMNVLSYLASEYFFEQISNELLEESKTFNYSEIYSLLSSFELQPEMIDFLVAKFESYIKSESVEESKSKRNRLVTRLLSLINERSYLEDMSENSVKFALLLFILFLQLNDQPYSASEPSQHFFKDMQFVVNCAKNLNIPKTHVKNNHRYLLERYFIGCVLRECNFKRLNLKYYNFSETRIETSSFLQCKFSKNRFDSASFKRVVFENCIFTEQKFRSFSLNGNVKFVNCQFNKVTFSKSYAGHTLFFDNCILVDVTFDDISSKLDFCDCSIKDVKINDSKLQVYVGYNSYFNKQKITGKNSEIGTNECSVFSNTKVKSSKTIAHFDFEDDSVQNMSLEADY